METESRWQRLRRHPILGRLPFLLVLIAGLWLWRSGSAPHERELFVSLSGPGAAQVRSMEAQFTTPGGEVTQRTQRFFQGAPPPEVKLSVRLPEGQHPVLVFLEDAEGQPYPVQRLSLEVTEAGAASLRVHVPARLPPGR
ncbi:MAG: hypothetical protein L0Y66_23050 [Myxococcaceae bacterium]|nr:hypothetical protein [Myxococcaceae bacterium]MCI0669075.1 hypothetical protein [Myxococcaceae bacterium]